MEIKKYLIIAGFLFAQLSFANAKEVKVGVNGMVCSFCAQGITKKFKAEPSVEAVDVKLSEKTVKLTLKDTKDIPDDRINEILKDAGYTVVKIERVDHAK